MENLTSHPGAVLCLIVFTVAYVIVLFEEKMHLPKSKPMMLGAGVLWVIIGLMARSSGSSDAVRGAIMHALEEYGALLLFLLSSMTFIAALIERRVFESLRAKLSQARFNLRQLFWITGVVAFFLSPLADNLTNALIMGAVIMAVGGNYPKFIALSCINIVNATNAGGVFSAFGDIPMLMVWQAGKLSFFEFFPLFIPAFVNFLVPSIIISFFVPKTLPEPIIQSVSIKCGGKTIIFLGLLTVAMAVGFEQMLNLPPFFGMMVGLSLLTMWSYFINKMAKTAEEKIDIMKLIGMAEWDTLLFFFGVIFSVSALAYLGWLELASTAMYQTWSATTANITLGVVSAILDNIPMMYAVLHMNPPMDHFQWQLITLTAGTGGSLLSIGSVAGVALMGVARGQYTFMAHLKWIPVLALGYATAIITHFLING